MTSGAFGPHSKTGNMGSRRGHREGTIFQRKDGRWVAVIQVGWKNGKRVRQHFYGKTRKEVSGKLTKALKDQQEGLPVAFERQSVEAFLRRWLRDTAKPRVRARTFADYKYIVEEHLIPSLGHLRLHELNPQDVQQLITEKIQEGLSPRRVALIRAVLRTALNHAMKFGAVMRNASALADAPRAKRFEPTILSSVQARAFLKAAEKHRLGILFTVALAVGLRLGEALAVGWEDVDLTKGSLCVRRSLQWIGNKLEFVEPKTDRSRRTVPLPAKAVELLKRHRTKQKRDRLKAGSQWKDSGLVFTSSLGTPLDDRNVRKAFGEILESAKLPHMRIHDLRHTCASLLLAQGVHPRVVMEILGHSQISVTLDTYSHVLPTISREAAQQMDAVLKGA